MKKNTVTNNFLEQQYLTVDIGDQRFGLPVQYLRDIFKKAEITPIPLSSNDVLGSINLRGRIVTVVDLRRKFDISNTLSQESEMHVAVSFEQELFSLVVDKVGEVILLNSKDFEPLPPTLEQKWKSIAVGVCKLNDALLMPVDMDALLKLIVDR